MIYPNFVDVKRSGKKNVNIKIVYGKIGGKKTRLAKANIYIQHSKIYNIYICI